MYQKPPTVRPWCWSESVGAGRGNSGAVGAGAGWPGAAERPQETV